MVAFCERAQTIAGVCRPRHRPHDAARPTSIPAVLPVARRERPVGSDRSGVIYHDSQGVSSSRRGGPTDGAEAVPAPGITSTRPTRSIDSQTGRTTSGDS